ncbi:MAG: ribosome recycling factor [Gammaproteobacteria bacterium]
MADKITQETEQRMIKSLEAYRVELGKMRTGRASPGLLEHIKVISYGQEMFLNQIASITVEGSRTLAITPWDKSQVSVIEKAIRSADLGLNPTAAGQVIRVPLPPLTEERRRDLVKLVRDEAERARVAVRTARRDANQNYKDLLKAKKISEDDERRGQADIQKMTDKFISEIDKMLATKETDLMEV